MRSQRTDVREDVVDPNSGRATQLLKDRSIGEFGVKVPVKAQSCLAGGWVVEVVLVGIRIPMVLTPGSAP